ncbi:MAG: KdsC family phosphatase [Bacteroidota bacterium]
MPQKAPSTKVSKDLAKRLQQLKAIVTDVDGVLTDGRIIYSGNGDELKEFHVRDGMIVGHLKKAGLVVGIISGRESAAVTRRGVELKLDFCHQGIEDKSWAVAQIMKHHGLKAKEIAFLGDDINDLVVFDLVGFRVCPSDAPPYIKERADVVTTAAGGKGVLREFGDLWLAATGRLDKIIKATKKKD